MEWKFWLKNIDAFFHFYILWWNSIILTWTHNEAIHKVFDYKVFVVFNLDTNSVMNLLGQSLHFKKPSLSGVNLDSADIFQSRFLDFWFVSEKSTRWRCVKICQEIGRSECVNNMLIIRTKCITTRFKGLSRGLRGEVWRFWGKPCFF